MSAPETAAAFEDFGKIERFRKVVCTITEKIDGTNAQVYIPEDPEAPIQAGSRNRWVTPESDNAGFARWVSENAEALRRLGPGRHFGEWYGSGIQRGYGLTEKRFAIFNVSRFKNGLPEGLPSNVHLVPVLLQHMLDNAKITEVVENLYTTGSVAVPGYKHPEGVIITCAGLRWKITDNGDVHKGQVGQQVDHVKAAAAGRQAAKEAAANTPYDHALRRVLVDKNVDGTFTITCDACTETVADSSKISDTRKLVAERAAAALA